MFSIQISDKSSCRLPKAYLQVLSCHNHSTAYYATNLKAAPTQYVQLQLGVAIPVGLRSSAMKYQMENGNTFLVWHKMAVAVVVRVLTGRGWCKTTPPTHPVLSPPHQLLAAARQPGIVMGLNRRNTPGGFLVVSHKDPIVQILLYQYFSMSAVSSFAQAGRPTMKQEKKTPSQLQRCSCRRVPPSLAYPQHGP